MKSKNIALLIVLSIALPLRADSTARTILYHAKDIVNIRSKVKYTTLIQLPATEKIIEAATGDKEFWIIDVVGNFCFVHPAKKDIRSNLNLITDKGNIYSFTLENSADLYSGRTSFMASTGFLLKNNFISHFSWYGCVKRGPPESGCTNICGFTPPHH